MNPKQKQNQIALLQRHKSVKPQRRHRLGDSDFKETVVFSLARRDTPILLAALNKLHTYFVLSELYKELIGDFNIELLFGLAESRTVELGGHFNQVIAAEEEVPFTGCL